MSKENRRLNGVDQNPNFIDRLSIRARDIFSNLKGFKEVDSKDIHIEGIDPKSYGSFDRFMDGATKFFRKHGIEVAALFALTGCTTGGAVGVSVLTSEPHETSTLPSPDSTKTLQSPTEANYELTSTPESLATQELTLVSETEVATETVPGDFISINMDNIIYPPVGSVKENFEKGEYDAGVETIKQWVGVWEKMGVFEELEIENNSLSPVPLDGRSRIVCVRANEETPLLCPPLDLINGGLKAVPEEGKWDETDKPLMITLERLEELISKGSETDLAYQFIDKYQKYSIKYIDPKTGQMVEGEYLAPSEEIILPDIVPEKMNSIGEYDLGMEFIDSQSVYRMFVEGFLSNEEANGDYWRDLLNGNVTYDAFMSYLRNNVGGPENKNYWWPMTSPNGIDFKPFSGRFDINSAINYTDEKVYGKGVYLDGIYHTFFNFIQYDSDPVLKRFVDEIINDNYSNSLYPLAGYQSSFYNPMFLFGLQIKNNHFILMVGSMATPVGVPDGYKDSILGFSEKSDVNIISALVLGYVKGMHIWKSEDRLLNNIGYCHIDITCTNGISYKNVDPIVKKK